jgi:hypothetical protein
MQSNSAAALSDLDGFTGREVSADLLPSLLDALSTVPDFRRRQGRRYPLASVLAFGVVATLCGYKSYGAMAEWGQHYGTELALALGFKNGRVPSVGTLFTHFSQVDKAALEGAVNRWAEQVLSLLPDEGNALAGDGKVLRGSLSQGAMDTLLLSVVSQRLGLTVFQVAGTDKSHEAKALPKVLETLLLSGRTLTLDAAHTSRRTAADIVEKGATIC